MRVNLDGAFLCLQRAARRMVAAGGGGRLALVCPTPRLLRPFEIAGLTSRLDIFSTRDDALLGLAAASS